MKNRKLMIASAVVMVVLTAIAAKLYASYRVADIISDEAIQDDRQQIAAAVDQQMADYPESTLKDIYKNFFQDAFGPGHLMSDAEDAGERMASYLRNECKEAETDVDPSPAYVKTGWHGRFYRVNLSVINDGLIPFDTFLKSFMESARCFTLPSLEEWGREWAMIEDVVRSCGYAELPDFESDSEAIRMLLSEGQYASHHSLRYEKAYHPHYRLIEKEIFERELLPYCTIVASIPSPTN